MRGLALAIGVILLPGTAILTGGADDHRATIRKVFETAFDQSRPLAARLPLVEDRDALRETLPAAARYGVVGAKVEDVRVYRDRAQVQFQFLRAAGGSIGNPLPFGVAVRKRDRWLVSRFTLCELLSFVGRSCAGTPLSDGYFIGEPFHPKPADGSDPRATGLTLPDGTGMSVTLPEGFGLPGFTIRSQAMLDFVSGKGPPRILLASYRPATVPTLTRYPGPNGEHITLDYRGNLNFRMRDWIARIYAADVSEGQRAFLARHAHFNVTSDGMFEYIGDGDLTLKPREPLPPGGPGRSAPTRPAKGGLLHLGEDVPQLAFQPAGGAQRDGMLLLARTGCDDDGVIRRPSGTSPTHDAGQRCFPGTGLELGVEGFDAETVDRLLTETSIRVVAQPVAERVVC